MYLKISYVAEILKRVHTPADMRSKYYTRGQSYFTELIFLRRSGMSKGVVPFIGLTPPLRHSAWDCHIPINGTPLLQCKR